MFHDRMPVFFSTPDQNSKGVIVKNMDKISEVMREMCAYALVSHSLNTSTHSLKMERHVRASLTRTTHPTPPIGDPQEFVVRYKNKKDKTIETVEKE